MVKVTSAGIYFSRLSPECMDVFQSSVTDHSYSLPGPHDTHTWNWWQF